MLILVLYFRSLSLLFFTILILTGCLSNNQKFNLSGLSNFNVNSDFTIEGKFLINLNNSTQIGYFSIKKEANIVQLKFGKNFFLPEKELVYNINSNLNLFELSDSNLLSSNINLKDTELNIRSFLETFSGKTPSNLGKDWNVYFYKGYKNIDGYKLPKRIKYIYNSFSLEIILNKIIIK